MRNLASLPAETLINILSFVNLEDILTFPSVCRTFSSLAENRVLWIKALNAERSLRPIACSEDTELVSLGLTDLRYIAQQTYRLQRTWAINHPDALRISSPIKVILLDVPGKCGLLGQVPETELYVFYSCASGEVFALDASIGERVCGVYVGGSKVLDFTPGRKIGGNYSIGLLTLDNTSSRHKILIACLEYEAFGGPRITITFEHAFEPRIQHSDLFMTNEFIGAYHYLSRAAQPTDIPHPLQDGYARIAVVNIATNRLQLITTTISYHNLDHFNLCAVKDNVCIILGHKSAPPVFMIPRSVLPCDDNPDVECISTSLGRDWTKDPTNNLDEQGFYYQPDCTESAADLEKGLVVSVQSSIHYELDYIMTEVRLWAPNASESGRAESSVVTSKWYARAYGALMRSGHSDVDGNILGISSSGRMVVFMLRDLMDDINEQPRLVVVDPSLDRCVAHELSLPTFINLDSICAILIDEKRGVISVYTTDETLFIVPYARNLQVLGDF
ncbi:hypothetical protein BDN70DRAFT_370736 [Pholiota conissans]|uniref:F-box domain-containing protein n=1 Tax=Pholiota conissans TaxID=109636 RepID=A0A9P5ZEN2_9AGAR|nr:hypothetical protein BDN70DRAFT_370736 [Pholiota conissans]